ncbi:MAG: phosphatidylglycerophosphatase A [Gammaproteobacteria bacterium]|nr:phosphatidylglycerophosphatase A [Gammaproteobacteria bacterium]
MSQKPKFRLSNPIHFLALGFGSGLLKPAPGTWGTLAAVPIYWLIVHVMALSLEQYLLLTVTLFLVGIYLCGKTARDVGVPDHSSIVWDEIVGFLVTMLAVTPSLINLAAGFALFRMFDIVKPWPIGKIDKSVHGGFGIMIDDVIAGLGACLALHLLQPLMV